MNQINQHSSIFNNLFFLLRVMGGLLEYIPAVTGHVTNSSQGHAETLSCGQFRVTNQHNSHVSGQWEAARDPRENPCKHWENKRSSDRKNPAGIQTGNLEAMRQQVLPSEPKWFHREARSEFSSTLVAGSCSSGSAPLASLLFL